MLTAFVTEIHHGPLLGPQEVQALAQACAWIAAEDLAGQRWSRQNGYPGYTSYASLNDLPRRDPAFAALAARLDPEVAAFAEALELDLQGRALRLDSLWVNVLAPGGMHSGHIHPHSVVSGTVYVAMPAGAGGLKFEDPRLAMLMAAPPRRAAAAPERASFRYLAPAAGDVALWESWLRHEALANGATEPRVSVSFNYRWG